MKILIVSLDNLGDTIISLSLLNYFKQNPEYSVSFFVKDYTKDLFSILDEKLNVYSCDPFWDRSPGRDRGSFFKFLKTIFYIRKEKFDVAIVLYSNSRKNLSCKLANIKEIWGFKGKFTTRLIATPSKAIHILDKYQYIIKELTGKFANNLDYSISNLQYIPQDFALKEFFKTNQSLVTIHPFSGDKRKNIEMYYWLEIIDFLQKKQLKTMVIATEEEKVDFLNYFKNKNRDYYNNKNIFFSCDFFTDLKNLAYCIKNSILYIGNDSGPLHLASALGTKSIGFFHADSAKVISPKGKSIPTIFTYKTQTMEIKSNNVIKSIEKLLKD